MPPRRCAGFNTGRRYPATVFRWQADASVGAGTLIASACAGLTSGDPVVAILSTADPSNPTSPWICHG